MKRDLDLIRLLLINQEGKEKVDLSQYTEDQIRYHQALLINAHFVERHRDGSQTHEARH